MFDKFISVLEHVFFCCLIHIAEGVGWQHACSGFAQPFLFISMKRCCADPNAWMSSVQLKGKSQTCTWLAPASKQVLTQPVLPCRKQGWVAGAWHGSDCPETAVKAQSSRQENQISVVRVYGCCLSSHPFALLAAGLEVSLCHLTEQSSVCRHKEPPFGTLLGIMLLFLFSFQEPLLMHNQSFLIFFFLFVLAVCIIADWFIFNKVIINVVWV